MTISLGPAFRPPKWRGFCCLAVCLAASQPRLAWSQMDMAAHTMGTEDQTPPSELPAPRKMTGIGNAHLQITATPEAQM